MRAHKLQKTASMVEVDIQGAHVLNPAKVTTSRSLRTFKIQLQRVIIHRSRKITLFVVEQLKDLELDVQQLVIEKFLAHSLIQHMIPNFLPNLECVKQNHKVILNMKSGIAEHLIGARKSELVATKGIVCMLASSSFVVSGRVVARVLGVDKQNIRKALNRWV
jgi:hypothetical protein